MLYHWYFVWQFEPTATLFLQIDSINSLGIHRFAVLFYYLWRDCPGNYSAESANPGQSTDRPRGRVMDSGVELSH